MLLLLLACALRPGANPDALRARALAAAEGDWAARANPARRSAAIAAWRALLAADPTDPIALGRLARAEWTLGTLNPAEAVVHFESAQDYAWRCLLASPAFSAEVRRARSRLTGAAAATLPPDAGPCLTWAVVGGVALVGVRGPGAALELEDIDVLLTRAEALAGATPAEDPGFLPWARGRWLVLGAAPDAPPAAARDALAAAVTAAPGVGLFYRDLAAAFPDDASDGGFLSPTPDPWAAENAAWAVR